MPSDIISAFLIFITGLFLIKKKETPKIGYRNTFFLLFLYILIGLISGIVSPLGISFIDFIKEPYLFLTSISAVLILSYENYKSKLLGLCIHYSFLIILFFGLFGYFLYYLGFENSLTTSSRIINVALPFFDNVNLPPRALSLIKPTSNLLAIYLTLYFPIFIYNYQINIKKIYKNNKISICIYKFAVFLTPLLSIFTYSRAFIPLLLLIFFVRNSLIENKKYLKRFVLLLSSFTFIFLFISIQFFTIFYTTNTNFSISNNPADDYENKEIVNLGNNKKRPNPVYLDDKEKGKKTINFQTDLHFNHYFWLKKSALNAKHDTLQTKLLGFGPSSYKKFITSKYADLDNSIKSGLQNFIGTQSQIFTTLLTHGRLGLVILILLLLNFLLRLMHSYSGEENVLISKLKIYLFTSIILISIDCDISNIRFVWALFPYLYFIEKSVFKLNNIEKKI